MLARLCSAPQISMDDTSDLLASVYACDAPSMPSTPASSPAASPSRRLTIRKRIHSFSNVTATLNSVLRREASHSGHAKEASAGADAKAPTRRIGPPSAFKHQFHLAPDSRTGMSSWDESRWRQVIETRMNEQAPVIDVGPPSPCPMLTRASTSSEHSSGSNATLCVGASINVDSHVMSSASAAASEPNKENVTPRTQKRASLVKRKPVPPLYPDEADAPAPPTPPAPAPAAEATVLTPTAPAQSLGPQSPFTFVFAPTTAPMHIPISRSSSPPPTVPPRRHTLGHAQSLRRAAAFAPVPGSSSGSATVSAPRGTTVHKKRESSSSPSTSNADSGTGKDVSAGVNTSPRPSFSSLTTSESESAASALSASSATSETSAESAALRTPTEGHDDIPLGGTVEVAVAVKVAVKGVSKVRRVEVAPEAGEEDEAYETADEAPATMTCDGTAVRS